MIFMNIAVKQGCFMKFLIALVLFLFCSCASTGDYGFTDRCLDQCKHSTAVILQVRTPEKMINTCGCLTPSEEKKTEMFL